jgi:hypothetical protein
VKTFCAEPGDLVYDSWIEIVSFVVACSVPAPDDALAGHPSNLVTCTLCPLGVERDPWELDKSHDITRL